MRITEGSLLLLQIHVLIDFTVKFSVEIVLQRILAHFNVSPFNSLVNQKTLLNAILV